MKNKNIPFILLVNCVALTASRGLGCNSSGAGINAVTVGAFQSLTKIAKTNTGVTEIASIFGAGTLARFEVKNTTTKYLENGTSGGDNRSKGVKGTLPVILNVPPGGDIALNKDVEQLTNGPVVFFIERKNGDIYACGTQTGAEVTTVDSDTGGQTGDLDGYTITFSTDEPDFSRGYKLVGQALVDYAAALMAVA